jgi:hypothetical protein
MEASMREKRSLVLYSGLKNNWEKEMYIEVCTFKETRGTGRWKVSS